MARRRDDLTADLVALLRLGTDAGLTDAQLLARFLDRRDEAGDRAFAVLVERHGPMVLRVCRAVLGDADEAQDAFQATFLVLARRAGAIRRRDSLASWLHGVALRVAARARASAARRRSHERRAADRPESGDGPDSPRDWEAVLQEEIDRLPEPFRAPILLCDLLGLTHGEAAERLGWPIGTVKSRQARARQRLRSRLDRRGVGPMLVGRPATPTGLPAGLAEATIQALSDGTKAAGTVPAPLAALIEETVRAMIRAKLKGLAIFGLSAGLLVAGAGALIGRPGRADAPDQPSARPATISKPVAPDDPRRRLVEIARRRLEAQRAFYEEGRITINRFIDASQQLMAAEVQAGATRADRVAAARAHLDRLKAIEARERAEQAVGRATIADVMEAEEGRVRAEVALLTASEPAGPDAVEDLKGRLRAVEEKLDRALKDREARPGPDPGATRKVRPRFECLVERIEVKVGQDVKTGDTLAGVFSTELAGAKNDYLAKETRWARDRRLRELREKLYQKGAISEQVWVETENDEEASHLARDVARDRLRLYGLTELEIKHVKDEDGEEKAWFRLHAPIDGTVIAIEAGAQDILDAKSVLMVIAAKKP